ncbi:TPA: B12-binding domain-containing radical SAM protein [Candidatus Berkelbacteria bacterium]|uniref:Radical SAM domain-containing protein n=1 Tax=Berkelbacteria bacterium GW2011_GWE1_39_12 TaxID=1618337 RepID=A0A0G4B2Y2_9BACT|nr:MAG: Radical SAM domain-containing protein [Berkelbacteria bacterium GW2011_GWE1_39_12]HBO60892.1 B12-binding domain-containing radical SAM protein [Candidatus Berkelbacteria bacterium]
MKIEKIALVEPVGVDWFNIYALTRMPRGIPLLAAILRQTGYQVDCYVGSIKKIKLKDLMQYDVIGFSAISCTIYPTHDMIRKLIDMGFVGKIIVGGPHATVLPAESIITGADVVVRNEGDKALLEVIAAFESGSDLGKIAGIHWWDGETIRSTPNRPFLTEQELSELPFPALDSIVGLERMNLVPITFSRGCPYQCEFCGVAGMYGSRYRCTTVEWRVAQVRNLKENYPEIWATTAIFFTDDNLFGTPRSREVTIEFLNRLVAEDLVPPMGFVCQIRVADATPEIAALFKKANCCLVCMGIESADDKALKLLNKEQTAEDIRVGLANLHAEGLNTLAMTIAGTDEDTFWSFWRSIRQLTKWGITYLQVLNLVPLVGTPMTKRFMAEGRKCCENYDRHNGMHVTIKPKKMSRFGVWASLYLVCFGWFYGRLLLKPSFKYRKLIWVGALQELKRPWEIIRNRFRR